MISENSIAFVGILGCDILLERYIADSHWGHDTLDPAVSSLVISSKILRKLSCEIRALVLHFDFNSYSLDLYSIKLWLCMAIGEIKSVSICNLAVALHPSLKRTHFK